MSKKKTVTKKTDFRASEKQLINDIKNGNYKPLNEYIFTATGMIEHGREIEGYFFSDSFYFKFFGYNTEILKNQSLTVLQKAGMDTSPTSTVGIDCAVCWQGLFIWIKKIVLLVLEQEYIKLDIDLFPAIEKLNNFEVKCNPVSMIESCDTYPESATSFLQTLNDTLKIYDNILLKHNIQAASHSRKRQNKEYKKSAMPSGNTSCEEFNNQKWSLPAKIIDMAEKLKWEKGQSGYRKLKRYIESNPCCAQKTGKKGYYLFDLNNSLFKNVDF